MSTAHNLQVISVRDYLDGEVHALQKHEYVGGAIYSMAGGTNVHNRIATNATVLLGSQLRGRPCQVYNSDTKVRIVLACGTCFYYPDASVVCKPNPPSDTFHESPVVIVEVISQASRRTDEHEKREAYLSIDSLCEYILVEQNCASALVYRRSTNGFITERYNGLEAIIALPEINCNMALIELYANVEFPTADQIREQEKMYSLGIEG